MNIELREMRMGLWSVTINGKPIMVGGESHTKEKALFNALIENPNFADTTISVYEWKGSQPR